MIEVVTTMLGIPSHEQLDEMVHEATEVLESLADHPIARGLLEQASQCRAALRASRLHGFGPFVQRAMATKVLRLKIDALSFRESRIAQEREPSELFQAAEQAAEPAWGAVEPPEVTRSFVAIPGEQV